MENTADEEIFKVFEIPLDSEKFVHGSPMIDKIQHETDKEMHEYIAASNYRTYMSKRGLPISEVTRKEMVPNMQKVISLYKTSEKNKISSPALIDREVLLEERHKNRDLETHFINKIHDLCDRAGLNYQSYVLGDTSGGKAKHSQSTSSFNKNEYYSKYTDMYKELITSLNIDKRRPEDRIMSNMAKEIKDFLEKEDFALKLDEVQRRRRINQFEKYNNSFKEEKSIVKNKRDISNKSKVTKKLDNNKQKNNPFNQSKKDESNSELSLVSTKTLDKHKMKPIISESSVQNCHGQNNVNHTTSEIQINDLKDSFNDPFKVKFTLNDPIKQANTKKFQHSHNKQPKLHYINPRRTIDTKNVSDMIDHRYDTHTQRHKIQEINKMMVSKTQPRFFKNLTSRESNYEHPITNYDSVMSKKDKSSVQKSSKGNNILPRLVGTINPTTTSTGYDYTRRVDHETAEDMSSSQRYNMMTHKVWSNSTAENQQNNSKDRSALEKISSQNEDSEIMMKSNRAPKTSQDFNKEFWTNTNLVEPQRKQRHNWTQTNFKGLEFKKTMEWKKHIDKVFDETGVFKMVKYTTLDDKAEVKRKKAKRAWLKKKMEIAMQNENSHNDIEQVDNTEMNSGGEFDNLEINSGERINTELENEMKNSKFIKKTTLAPGQMTMQTKAELDDFKSLGIKNSAVKEVDSEGSIYDNMQANQNTVYGRGDIQHMDFEKKNQMVYKKPTNLTIQMNDLKSKQKM